MMKDFKIGDAVYATYGTMPLAGIIVAFDEKMGKFLVRFSGVQQDWYSAGELKFC